MNKFTKDEFRQIWKSGKLKTLTSIEFDPIKAEYYFVTFVLFKNIPLLQLQRLTIPESVFCETV
jgi:hypothetical protein